MITGPAIEVSQKGTIMIGLKAIGAPNTRGSFILKIDGPIQILPMTFNFFAFENIIMTFNGSVAPIPPIVIKAAVNTVSDVTIFTASFPAATASIFP